MQFPTQLLFILAAFLVPVSQAVVSNNDVANMNAAGYYCATSQEIRTIQIHYGSDSQGLPCRVTYERSNKVTQLLQADRSTAICEHKAEIMAARLIDRGWHCEGSGLQL